MAAVTAAIDAVRATLPAQRLPAPEGRHNVLGLDGSHATVMLQLTLLERLEEVAPGMLDAVALISGTQLSAVAVVMLAQGYRVAAVKQVMRLLLHFHPRVSGVTGALTAPMYTGTLLHAILDALFGDATLRSLPRLVAINALQADTAAVDPSGPRTHHAVLFTNYRAGAPDDRVVDVCMRAAAMPGYFPPYQGYLSGYLVDNSPFSLCLPTLVTELGWALPAIACLAVSEGSFEPRFYRQEDYGASGYRWLPQMFNVFALSRKSYALKAGALLLGPAFHAVDPEVPPECPATDPAALEAFARTVDLSAAAAWVADRWLR